MEKKIDRLYIPANVRKRKEIVAGFGGKELILTIIMAGLGLVLGIVIYMWNEKIEFVVTMPIVMGVIAIIFLIKDQTNTSLLDSIIRLILFIRSQKRYYYKYYNIYEKEKYEKKNRTTNSNDK